MGLPIRTWEPDRAAAAWQRVEGCFTWEISGRQLVQAYREVLNPHALIS